MLIPTLSATAEQLSPSTTVYRMRPSGPGVEVANPCAGGAASTELADNIKPMIKMVKKNNGIKKVLRIFIGGDYIRDVQQKKVGAGLPLAAMLREDPPLPTSGEFICYSVYESPAKNNHRRIDPHHNQ